MHCVNRVLTSLSETRFEGKLIPTSTLGLVGLPGTRKKNQYITFSLRPSLFFKDWSINKEQALAAPKGRAQNEEAQKLDRVRPHHAFLAVVPVSTLAPHSNGGCAGFMPCRVFAPF
jgi:hypothetical protein